MTDTAESPDTVGQRIDAAIDGLRSEINARLDAISARVDEFQAAIDERQGQ